MLATNGYIVNNVGYIVNYVGYIVNNAARLWIFLFV
jgi:hypothetical protein